MRVLFIAPIYKYYPQLVPSLLAQTYKNWRLLLFHDGPDFGPLKTQIEAFNDPRVELAWTDRRYNDWGHSLRAIGLRFAKDADFIVHTNADNYYVPDFCNQMVHAFREETVAVYCDMVHSYYSWGILPAKIQFGKIDCGAVMFRAKVALEIGWPSRAFAADWVMINEVHQKYRDRFEYIPRPLFVHN
jgi:hypothetical protein